MNRRAFVLRSALGSVALTFGRVRLSGAATTPIATRKILIAGGNFNTPFIRYMATLTGKSRPKLLYFPTASADSATGSVTWFENCAPLNVEASVQNSFIASTRQTR